MVALELYAEAVANEEEREVRLTIADDGSGFDASRLPDAGRYSTRIVVILERAA